MQNLTFLNGDTMPILGLGTWKSRPGEVYNAIRKAIEIGYRHFDCARIYDNEEEIGQALADAIAAGEVKRTDLWITSKLWNDAHAEHDVRRALERALTDLKLDYLDLYLVHWPIAFEPQIDPATSEIIFAPEGKYPMEATWKAMEDCNKSGLARHIGVSNFIAAKIEAIMRSAEINPEMNQVELHPFLAQDDLIQFCHKNHIHLTAYAPLGSKGRSDALKKVDEPDLLSNPVIMDISLRNGMTPAQVLICWSLERGVAVIPKSVRVERLKQNFDSANFSLNETDMKAIAQLDRHRRFFMADFWMHEGSPLTSESLWGE
jgi:alcohol dehydrogenase (NADP+)